MIATGSFSAADVTLVLAVGLVVGVAIGATGMYLLGRVTLDRRRRADRARLKRTQRAVAHERHLRLAAQPPAGRPDDLPRARAEAGAFGERCPDCGGPLEGWAGEHHSVQCEFALGDPPYSAAGGSFGVPRLTTN